MLENRDATYEPPADIAALFDRCASLTARCAALREQDAAMRDILKGVFARCDAWARGARPYHRRRLQPRLKMAKAQLALDFAERRRQPRAVAV
jgi:hypothetical protein